VRRAPSDRAPLFTLRLLAFLELAAKVVGFVRAALVLCGLVFVVGGARQLRLALLSGELLAL
jgi:hypothetical protein